MAAILIIETTSGTEHFLSQHLSNWPEIKPVASDGSLYVFSVASPDSSRHVLILEQLAVLEAVKSAYLFGGGYGFQMDDTTRQILPWLA